MIRGVTAVLFVILTTTTLSACHRADEAGAAESAPGDVASGAAAESISDRQAVEITTSDYAFEGPAELLSGWTTLRMTNAGEQPHFLLLWRLPEDRTFDEFASEIAAPFNELYAEYHSGRLGKEELFTVLGETLPEWFSSLERKGGVGYISSGRSVEATVLLEPGDYVMECYVKAPQPEVKFHNALGMLRPLIVASESAGAEPPPADVAMTLSNYTIAIEGELTAGKHTVRVEVTEEPEGGLIGHNVQLVQLEGDATAEEAAAWLDWVDALEPPAPVEFLGGTGQLQAGATSYFTVDLEPGRYAFVSEGYAHLGMVSELTVE